jgi:antitoxin component YwqK of YwqJK toxin-antitoxin module
MASKQPDKPNYNLLTIVLEEQKTSQHFTIINKKLDIDTDNELEYFWFNNNRLNSNYGGYTGNILHGNFMEFDSNGKLKIKGSYHFGLKNKKWQTWDRDGNLLRDEFWRKGWLVKRMVYKGDTTYVEPYKKNKLHGSCTTRKGDSILEVKKYRNGVLINEKEPKKKD